MAVIISILLLNLKTKTINLPLIIPFYLNNGTFEIERASSEPSELIHNEPWLKCLHFILGTDFSSREWSCRCCCYRFCGISADSCISPEVITDISSIDWILRYRMWSDASCFSILNDNLFKSTWTLAIAVCRTKMSRSFIGAVNADNKAIWHRDIIYISFLQHLTSLIVFGNCNF